MRRIIKSKGGYLMNQPLTLYRVKNWSDYNRILINRWNLDI